MWVAINEQPCARVSTGETATAGPGIPGTGRGLVFYKLGVEGVEFEPTNRGYLLAVFKSANPTALNSTFLPCARNLATYLPHRRLGTLTVPSLCAS